MKPNRWSCCVVLAVVLAVAGPFSRQGYASSQGQVSQKSDQKTSDTMLVGFTEVPPASSGLADYTPFAPPSRGSSHSDWTGVYVGISIGGSTGNGDTSVTPLPSAAQFINLQPQTLHPDPSGFVGGGQLGFNWQRRALVFGAEFDLSGSSIDGTTTV